MKMGKDPDYRFSLANERTFLAWIRTALAFLASAVGVDLLLREHPVGAMRHGQWLVITLALVAILTGGWAFLRWYQNEKAMRLEAPFRYSHSLSLLTCVMFGLGALVIALVL
ncbi:YidH family protein [Chania multitudinisentens]|nr:DUF202 domain-containing protein [Chania multitudinisentens]